MGRAVMVHSVTGWCEAALLSPPPTLINFRSQRVREILSPRTTQQLDTRVNKRFSNP